MARSARLSPAAMATDWPDVPVSNESAEAAQLLALALRDAMGPRSARTVSAICGVHQTTISAVLNGTTWPDLQTTARLEAGLGVDLWPTLQERTAIH